jgi:hypothetical protein
MPHLGLAIALAELIAAKDNTATIGETSC